VPRPNVVIVEGTCGSGKTTLLRSFHATRERESTLLSQRVTYEPIAAREDSGSLDDESNRRALLDAVVLIRGIDGLVLVDTLHATHFVRVGVLSVSSFADVDSALHDLGAMVVVLRISKEAIRERAVIGRRGTGFYEYSKKFGNSEDDRAIYFAREQERLLDLLASHSRLPQIVLDGEQPTPWLQASTASFISACSS
jgi:thymidylate kinase